MGEDMGEEETQAEQAEEEEKVELINKIYLSGDPVNLTAINISSYGGGSNVWTTSEG